MEFNTEFLQFSSLGTSIYRLQVQMSVWLEIPRRRPDRQLCDRLFWNESRPDGVAQSFRRSHLTWTQFSYQGFARPNHRNDRSDGWFDACNFHICSLHVRTMKIGVRTSWFWMHDLPYGWTRPDGNPHRRDSCSDLLIYVFWKEIP
jgi:hypothetical protein